jgi:capsular exopolysaccharide synthesis family protein
MSRIFDALLRSEAERSGVDVSSLSGATEVLERAERHASSDNAFPVEERPGGNGEARMAAVAAPVPGEFKEPSIRGGLLADDPRRDFDRAQTLQLPPEISHKLVSLGDQDGPVAEAFRFLGVRLRHMRRDRTLKKLLITSTIPQEGKSLVAANLACTLSLRTQQRTLLLEGDLRRPSLTELFGLRGKPGLCECLREETDLPGSMYQLPSPQMWVLPAGSSSGNYLELLQSGRIMGMVEELAEAFDWVIIDSPPVLPLADTSIWSRLADGILLVTRQGKTESRQLKKGLDAIESQKLIGAVLNSSSRPAHGDYYYYTERKSQEPSELSVR